MLKPLAKEPQRVDWIDCAKGICIILVVMMHATLGVEKALGQASWLGLFIEWARPFRMPDFFMISGLFLARRITAPWRSYADTKIVHFAYFYVLWMTIQFLFKGHGIYASDGLWGLARSYAAAFIEPFGTLWFIYLLAVFFAVTKLLHRVPPIAVLIGAALLEALPIHTGWTVIDEFAARYVYFFGGYWMAEHVFRFARHVAVEKTLTIVAALFAWAVLNGALVFTGSAGLPGISLVLGTVGALAVAGVAVGLARSGKFTWLKTLGANSIVVYLAFFIFMAGSRAALIRLAPGLGVDIIAAIVTLAGVAGPVVLLLAVRRTPLRYLFVRPAFAKLETWMKGWHSTAHEPSQKFSQPQAR